MSMLTPLGQGERRGGGAGRVLRRIVAVVLVLAALGGAGYASWYYLASRAPEPVRTACPPQPTPVAPKLPRPAAAKTVKVNVYNATKRSGLASTVAGELRKRKFKIGVVANDPLGRKITAAAEVRHGPRGAGAARTVAAQVNGKVVLVPVKRADASVDLVTGSAWKSTRSPAKAAAALKAKPKARASTARTRPGC